MSALLSPCSGRGREEEGRGERKQQVKRKRGRSWWTERACWFPSFQIFVVVYTPCAFWNECLVSNVPLCLCLVSEGRKERVVPSDGILRLRIFKLGIFQ